ncbi:hypothetical protein [Deinococcus sp. PEB2-67]
MPENPPKGQNSKDQAPPDQTPAPTPLLMSAYAYAARLDRVRADLLVTLHGEEKHTAEEWFGIADQLLNQPTGGQ